jgi:hypothetical protein
MMSTNLEVAMQTARELADQVIQARRAAWAKFDPSTAIVATEQLGPDDEGAVQKIVEEAGYRGTERDEMVRQVSAMVVGQVEALADDLPATAGD